MTTMALNRHVERVFNPERKDTHWGKLGPRAIRYYPPLLSPSSCEIIWSEKVGDDGSERP